MSEPGSALSSQLSILRQRWKARLSLSWWADTVTRSATGTLPATWTWAGWLLLGAALLLLAAQGARGVDPQDEGQFLSYPWLIDHGSVPYRDIWMSYPPAMYLVVAAIMKVGVPGVLGERALGFLCRMALVLLVNRALTGAWRRFSWLGVLPAFSLMFLASDLKPYPWVAAMPLLILGLLLCRSRPRIASAVFLLGALFRFEFGVAGMVAIGTLALLDGNSGRRREYVKELAILVAGVVIVYLLLDLLTAHQVIRDLFVDQILVIRRSVPLWPPAYGPLGLPAAVVMLLGPPAMVVVGLAARRPFITATNLAVLVLLPHFFQRADGSHLFSMTMLVVPWLVISLVELHRTDAGEPALPGWVRWFVPVSLGYVGITIAAWYALVVAAFAVYLSPLAPDTGQSVYNLRSRIVQGQNSIIVWDRDEERDDRRVVRFLARHAASRDRLFVTPRNINSGYTRTDLYYLLGLRPATRYLEAQAGIITQASVLREITRDLATCRWVVAVQGGRWYDPTVSSAPPGYALWRVLGTQYRVVLRTQIYEVLERQ